MKALVILLFFSFASYHQIKWHKNIYLNEGQRQELASIINDYYLPGSIVGFDADYGDISSELIHRYIYGFYLYNYQYKKIDASIWYDNRFGPLISYSKDLDDLYTNIFVIGAADGGTLLWVRSSDQESFMILNEWYEVAPNSLQTYLFIREGWHDIESSHVWSSGGATIKVKKSWFAETNLPKKLEMQISAFNASPERNAELFLSGENYFKRVVFVDQRIESVIIPIEFSSQRNDLDFSLKVPTATAPFKVINSDDTRIIGVALHKYIFSD